jgi:hypothetical protein
MYGGGGLDLRIGEETKHDRWGLLIEPSGMLVQCFRPRLGHPVPPVIDDTKKIPLVQRC